MKQWERHANDALRALGEAYQLGRIGRDTYRERRRRLMASFRDQSEVTARRAVAAIAAEPGVDDYIAEAKPRCRRSATHCR